MQDAALDRCVGVELQAALQDRIDLRTIVGMDMSQELAGYEAGLDRLRIEPVEAADRLVAAIEVVRGVIGPHADAADR